LGLLFVWCGYGVCGVWCVVCGEVSVRWCRCAGCSACACALACASAYCDVGEWV